MNGKIVVNGAEITVTTIEDKDYISLTDMLKAKDGDFFISDWLRNRNTVEFLGIWEQIHNPNFNYGEFATIRNHAGLNSFENPSPYPNGYVFIQNCICTHLGMAYNFQRL